MPFIRILFIILGSISLALGIIGVFLPLLPTTPFLLLTAFLYMKASPRYYGWLLRQPLVGRYIRDFRENRVIPPRAKVLSLTLMWGCMGYCAVFAVSGWLARILLAVIATGITIHILSFKSK